MNKEKQRIKIAKACGWRLFSSFDNLWAAPGHVVEYNCDAYPLPDYLNDLNAMHKALKLIGEIKGIDLCWHLNDMGISGEWQILNATAEELAEAAGWRIFSSFDNLWAPPKHIVEYNCDAYPLPDYFTDLNAVHELEKVIPDAKIDEYKHRLCIAATTNERITQCATAAQRCEAIGKTLNLW